SPLFDIPTWSARTPRVTPFRPEWLIRASPSRRIRSRVEMMGFVIVGYSSTTGRTSQGRPVVWYPGATPRLLADAGEPAGSRLHKVRVAKRPGQQILRVRLIKIRSGLRDGRGVLEEQKFLARFIRPNRS